MSFENYTHDDGLVKTVDVAKLLVHWRANNAKTPPPMPRLQYWRHLWMISHVEKKKLKGEDRFFGKKKDLEYGLVFCFGFWFFQIAICRLMPKLGDP